MESPIDKLSAEALRGLIEAYILRDGTDYGQTEVPFETKVSQLKVALQEGRARVLYDPDLDSFTVLTAEA